MIIVLEIIITLITTKVSIRDQVLLLSLNPIFILEALAIMPHSLKVGAPLLLRNILGNSKVQGTRHSVGKDHIINSIMLSTTLLVELPNMGSHRLIINNTICRPKTTLAVLAC